MEDKEQVKLRAESYDDVKRFYDILRAIAERHPGILRIPNRIVNMDENAVDASHGKRKKAFTTSTSHHGGFRGAATNYGTNQHITAVVIASASGRVTPPFLL